MKVYRLEFHRPPRSNWFLLDEETQKEIFHYTSKAVALRKAIELGRQTGGTLKVYNRMGEFQEAKQFPNPEPREDPPPRARR